MHCFPGGTASSFGVFITDLKTSWICLNKQNSNIFRGLDFFLLVSKKEKYHKSLCENVERCSASNLLLVVWSLNTFSPDSFFLCQLLWCSWSPGKGKWDHNLNVSVLKTMPAECYSLTAFMAMLRSLSDHRCVRAALGHFEKPSGAVCDSQVVKRNVPCTRCLNYSGMSG